MINTTPWFLHRLILIAPMLSMGRWTPINHSGIQSVQQGQYVEMPILDDVTATYDRVWYFYHGRIYACLVIVMASSSIKGPFSWVQFNLLCACCVFVVGFRELYRGFALINCEKPGEQASWSATCSRYKTRTKFSSQSEHPSLAPVISDVDFAKVLIELVKLYPLLYDIARTYLKCYIKKKYHWEEISRILNSHGHFKSIISSTNSRDIHFSCLHLQWLPQKPKLWRYWVI